MSEVYLRFRGREIREPELTFLRELIAQNPGVRRFSRVPSVRVRKVVAGGAAGDF